MKDLSDLDSLLDRISVRLSEGASANAKLQDELNKAKKQIEEKELDKIRALKEKDRVIEELEREKLNLQKEIGVLEGKIEEFFNKVRALVPDAGSFERRQS